jgi:hypothetical protein
MDKVIRDHLPFCITLTGEPKTFFNTLAATLVLLPALIFSTTAIAQDSSEYHPWLSDRFHIALGAFARDQNFSIRADGSNPEEEIDFDETLGVDDSDTSGSLTFRWNIGRKWSLWGQTWKVNSTGGAVLTEDVDFEDLVFQQGSFVNAGVENTVIRVFFGRTFSTGPRHEFGLGLGFHWLELGAFIEGEALINDIPSGFQRGDVSADGPMPNIGGWYYFSPSKRWLFEARLDWLDVSVGDYSGGIFNSQVGINFQAFQHLGVTLAYNYFSLNADVDSGDWRGGAELRYRGPFLALTTNW